MIMNTPEFKGDWIITRGTSKQTWARLADDDLRFGTGRLEELLGRIQKRTGENRAAIAMALKGVSCLSTQTLRPI